MGIGEGVSKVSPRHSIPFGRYPGFCPCRGIVFAEKVRIFRFEWTPKGQGVLLPVNIISIYLKRI
jgi:hypothetical protein